MNNKIMMKKVFKVKYIILYILLMITTVLTVVVGLLQPILFKNLLDNITYYKKSEYLYYSLLQFIGLFFISHVLTSTSMLLKAKLQENILVETRKEFYKNIINQNLSFFDRLDTGEILNRMLNELATIISFVMENIVKMVVTIITVISIVLLMIFMSKELAIMEFILCFIFLIATFIISPIYQKNEKRVVTQYSKVNNTIHENILNFKTIKYLNIFEFSTKNVYESLVQFKKTKLRYVRTSILLNIFLSILAYIPYIYMLYMGFNGVILGTLTVGTVTALINYLQQLMLQLNGIKEINIEFQKFKIMFNRMKEIMIEDKEITRCIGTSEFISQNDIRLKLMNVEFGYNGTSLFRIDAEFENGDVVLITGKNGSGKTSFINLLCGMLEPTKGKVLCNDVEIKDISIEQKKEILGVVPQNIQLFSGSVKNNLELGQEYSDEYLLDKIQTLNFEEFNHKFLKKKILNRGTNLSGGQIQRIGILRAIVREPKILILDEFSNSLDINSKEKVCDYVEKYRANRITFIVSHDKYIDIECNKTIEI